MMLKGVLGGGKWNPLGETPSSFSLDSGCEFFETGKCFDIVELSSSDQTESGIQGEESVNIW